MRNAQKLTQLATARAIGHLRAGRTESARKELDRIVALQQPATRTPVGHRPSREAVEIDAMLEQVQRTKRSTPAPKAQSTSRELVAKYRERANAGTLADCPFCAGRKVKSPAVSATQHSAREGTYTVRFGACKHSINVEVR